MPASDATIAEGGASDVDADGGSSDGQAADGSTSDHPEGGGSTALSACGVSPPVGASTGGLFLDLGHAGSVKAVYQSGSRVLSYDQAGRWILWDATTGLQVSTGLGVVPDGATYAAGTVFLVAAASSAQKAQIFSMTDGTRIGTLPVGSASLASDGSYAWAADGNGITAWSPTGAVLFSRSGNYDVNTVFAAPSELRVGLGPAGPQVIEYLALPGGTESTKPFSGTFQSFSFDGANFFTTAPLDDASSYVTVRDYDSNASMVKTVVLTSASGIQGMSGYYWTATGSLQGTDPMYLGAIGENPEFASVAGNAVAWISSQSSNHENIVTVMRLNAGGTREQITLPIGTFLFSTDGPSWVAGGYGGLVYASASSRYLGCGAATGLAGSDAGTLAIATASGRVLVMDVTSGALVDEITRLADSVALSNDGHVLASHALFTAGGTPFDTPSGPTDLSVVASDGGAIFVASGVTDFSLASTGRRIGWTATTGGGACTRSVVELPAPDAGPTVFADTGRCPTPLLSPSGTYIAATDVSPSTASTTFIYSAQPNQPASYLGSLSGVAKGWIDDGHLLIQTYSNQPPSTSPTQPSPQPPAYAATIICDDQGNELSTPSLPEMDSFTPVASSRLFAQLAPGPAHLLGSELLDWSTGANLGGYGASGGPVAITPAFVVVANSPTNDLPGPYPWGVIRTPY